MKKRFLIFLFAIFTLTLIFCGCDDECRHQNMIETKNEATCTENGQITHTCLDCGYTYLTNITEPVGHNFTKNKVEPQCTADGYTEYTCECGFSYVSDYVSATGHKYSDTVKTPTCDVGGHTTHTCTICNYSYISNHTDPSAHDLEEAVVSPTCTLQGYTVYKCKNCTYTYNSNYTAPLGHKYTSEILSEPSCTVEGKTKYTCACGDSYTVTVASEGHAFSSLVTMPTLSDMGYTEFSCTKCEFKYTGDYRFYSDMLPNGAYSNNLTPLAKGIDVSLNNYGDMESIDFNGIKNAGFDYVIIKAGSTYRENFTKGGKEEKFEQSYNDAKAAGLNVGAYFYTYATSVNEIIRDARLLISILDGKQFEYPIYLDVEDPSLETIDKATLTQMCVEFFTILQRAGYYTGLYVNNTWLEERIQTEVALSKFDIWYARPSQGEPVWSTEQYGEHLGMWQYSFEGTFDTMQGIPFDLNLSYKNYPEIIKSSGFNGYGKDIIKFIDSDKVFVYVKANSINIRSTSDFDSTENKIGTAYLGDCFEVIEKTDEYTKIIFEGKVAYISANLSYVSFEYPLNQ